MTDMLTTFLTIVFFLAAVGFYFLPTLVALERKTQVASIFALNLFLGWTLVGWVAALVLSLWRSDAKGQAAT